MFFNLTTLSNCSPLPNHRITVSKTPSGVGIEANRLHYSPNLALKGDITVATTSQYHRLPVNPFTLSMIGAVDGN